jgi:hypothetical protein
MLENKRACQYAVIRPTKTRGPASLLLSGPPKHDLPILEMYDPIARKTYLESGVLAQTYCCQRLWCYTPQLRGNRAFAALRKDTRNYT